MHEALSLKTLAERRPDSCDIELLEDGTLLIREDGFVLIELLLDPKDVTYVRVRLRNGPASLPEDDEG